MKQIEGGVTAAKGYTTAGTRAGIKKGKTNKDMAMIFSEKPAVTAGTFTKNLVKAAPVLWDKKVTDAGVAQAVVINTGIANACTGQAGYENAAETAKLAGEALNISSDTVLVASTGVIGFTLPMDVIADGVKKLSGMLKSDVQSAQDAAEAILTTDTHPKQIAYETTIGVKTVTFGAMCKGSGMIHPNMCTMLSFLMTDAAISKEMLQKALSADVDDTYNMISVDGDTSTNDTVLLLANGLAENPEITEEGEDYQTFARALHYINETLAKKMAGDGEGATALFETKVIGAQSKEQAKILAKSVICSNLTKAAIFGHDANWGRILCAMGYYGAKFDPEKVDLYFESAAGKLKIIENGVALDYSEEEATKVLSEKAVTAVADIKMGEASASAWGCDLTYDYVKINADYRS